MGDLDQQVHVRVYHQAARERHAECLRHEGQMQENMTELMLIIIESYKGGYNQLRKTVISHCLNLVNADVFN